MWIVVVMYRHRNTAYGPFDTIEDARQFCAEEQVKAAVRSVKMYQLKAPQEA